MLRIAPIPTRPEREIELSRIFNGMPIIESRVWSDAASISKLIHDGPFSVRTAFLENKRDAPRV